jgi:hypothetical protein
MTGLPDVRGARYNRETSEKRSRVDEICNLKQANGIDHERCEGESCVFWRAVDYLGQPTGTGCAVRHYELLGQEGMAEWLLSVKKRVESSTTRSE